MHLETYQWVLACLAAFGTGLSKTGISGLSVLSVAIFALVFPSRASVGVVLPILICADIVAVTAYRRHAVWSHLWKLFPWAALGVVLGTFAMHRINDQQIAQLIGVILLGLTFVQAWRRWMPNRTPDTQNTPEPAAPQISWLAIVMGILAGFTTMVANAAGPIMILYFLTSRMPKMEFIGTSAWFFMVLNLFKVPFSYKLGLINMTSLPFDLVLGPCAVMGALFGRWIIRYINQKVFELLALTLTLLAGLDLLFGHPGRHH